jgi:hypothetical protein
MSSMYGATGGGMSTKVPSGYKVGQLQQFTPEQMDLFKSLFGHVGQGSYLSRLASGDEGLFEEMERPALKQFTGLQGNLASRFSGMGLGARNSSGFQNTATQAASDFAQDLHSRRQGLQRQAITDLLGMGQELLGQRPYEQFLYEKKKPFWQRLLGGGLPIAGTIAGGLIGGPSGASMGGSLGSAAGEAFF